MSTPALDRLGSEYWNSRPKTASNPGGLAGGGHVINFPLLLGDVSAAALEAAGVLNGINSAAEAALGLLVDQQAAAKDAAVSQLNGIVSDATTLMNGKLSSADTKVAAAQAARQGSEDARDLSIAAKNDSVAARDAALVHANTAASNSAGHTGASTTTLTIGTGNKTLTIETGKKIVPGEWVEIANTASPTANAMNGKTVSYNPVNGELIVNVTSFIGAGEASAWTVSVSGARGPTGAGISNQANGFTLSGGTETARTLTVDADASVSDILALIAAAGGLTAIADGPIAARAPIALTAAGKLKAIVDTGFAGANGTPEVGPVSSQNATPLAAVACGGSTFLLLYTRGSEVYVRVGSVSGTAVSFGAEVSCGYGTEAWAVAACYDPVSAKAFIAYGGGPYTSKVRALTISGTTPSLGAATALGAWTGATSIAISFDPVAGRVIVAAATASYESNIWSLGVSGTTLTLGSSLNIDNASADPSAIALVYDPANARTCLLVMMPGPYLRASSFTLSGSSLVFGGQSTATPTTTSNTSLSAVYCSAIGKIVFVASASGTTSNGIEAGVLTFSGGVYAFSARQTIVPTTANGRRVGINSLAWDATRGQLFLQYVTQTDYYVASLAMTVTSAGVFTLGAPTVMQNATSYTAGALVCFSAFQHQVHIMPRTSGGASTIDTKVYGETFVNSSAPNCVGLASAAAADGASVKTAPIGTKLTGFAGLIPLADYFVTKDGGLSTTDTGYVKIGKAISATDLLITKATA